MAKKKTEQPEAPPVEIVVAVPAEGTTTTIPVELATSNTAAPESTATAITIPATPENPEPATEQVAVTETPVTVHIYTATCRKCGESASGPNKSSVEEVLKRHKSQTGHR